jgi:hypothetical protein
MDRVGLVDEYTIGASGGHFWIPPEKYHSLPKVGMWTGLYEMFRDFSIDKMNEINKKGYGMGVSIVAVSMGLRGLWVPAILNS